MAKILFQNHLDQEIKCANLYFLHVKIYFFVGIDISTVLVRVRTIENRTLKMVFGRWLYIGVSMLISIFIPSAIVDF